MAEQEYRWHTPDRAFPVGLTSQERDAGGWWLWSLGKPVRPLSPDELSMEADHLNCVKKNGIFVPGMIWPQWREWSMFDGDLIRGSRRGDMAYGIIEMRVSRRGRSTFKDGRTMFSGWKNDDFYALVGTDDGMGNLLQFRDTKEMILHLCQIGRCTLEGKKTGVYVEDAAAVRNYYG